MRYLIGATLTALFLTMTIQADAQTVEFNFRSTEGNGVAGASLAESNFDPSVAGDTINVEGLVVTVVDITAPEYDVTGDLPVATGNTLSSAAGDAVNTNIAAQDALGINNPSINNGTFDLIGDTNESNDLNPGETVTITFDHDVVFTAIELESVDPADIFNVLVDGEAMLETMGDDDFIDDLGDLAGLTIPAGTEITFEIDGVLETATGGPATSIRIETFTVDVVNGPLPPAPAFVLFDFNRAGVVGADEDGGNFDPSGAGDTITVEGLVTTVVDVIAPEYNLTGPLPVLTGNILSSAAGDAVVTNLSNDDAFGIANPSIANGTFDLIGDGDESSDLNPRESVTITFDQDVQFVSIELESVDPADIFNVLVDGEAVLETMGDDGFIDDLGGLAGLTIPVGSEITFEVDGVLENATGGPTTSIRIETFVVEIIESDDRHGDVNLDGTVNFLDISPFITVLAVGGSPAEASQADCNGDGTVNFLDISPFIGVLAGGGS